MNSHQRIWEIYENNHETAVGQRKGDTYAWSSESFEGDMKERLEFVRSEISDGWVIICGCGNQHSHGRIIFNVDQDRNYLVKPTGNLLLLENLIGK